MVRKIGRFEYDGNGKLLENGVQYTVFDIGKEFEAYPEGEGEPVTMNRGVFASLEHGRLQKV